MLIRFLKGSGIDEFDIKTKDGNSIYWNSNNNCWSKGVKWEIIENWEGRINFIVPFKCVKLHGVPPIPEELKALL